MRQVKTQQYKVIFFVIVVVALVKMIAKMLISNCAILPILFCVLFIVVDVFFFVTDA